MADPDHLASLEQALATPNGIETLWNVWREANPSLRPDLMVADLRRANLAGANLQEVNLWGTDLWGASLRRANLYGANLWGVNLRRADLSDSDLRHTDLSESDLLAANLTRADLREANLKSANLRDANLSQANLTGARLARASLVNCNLSQALLVNSCIYGISAWDVILEGTLQKDLVISKPNEPVITVDNLEVAQFIYLLLNNANIRHVIDSMTTKAVLILGRFTPERKVVLDALREALRGHNYVPIVFDFEQSTSRDLTETISTLAHLARFIIADLTEAKSLPQELQAIVPNLPSVAVQPIILAGQPEYALFEHFKRYPWVLPLLEYDHQSSLLATLSESIIAPAKAKAAHLQGH
jgi:hypothetical protein